MLQKTNQNSHCSLPVPLPSGSMVSSLGKEARVPVFATVGKRTRFQALAGRSTHPQTAANNISRKPTGHGSCMRSVAWAQNNPCIRHPMSILGMGLLSIISTATHITLGTAKPTHNHTIHVRRMLRIKKHSLC